MKCVWKTTGFEKIMILSWDMYNHEPIHGFKFLIQEDAIIAGI